MRFRAPRADGNVAGFLIRGRLVARAMAIVTGSIAPLLLCRVTTAPNLELDGCNAAMTLWGATPHAAVVSTRVVTAKPAIRTAL